MHTKNSANYKQQKLLKSSAFGSECIFLYFIYRAVRVLPIFHSQMEYISISYSLMSPESTKVARISTKLLRHISPQSIFDCVADLEI